MPRRWVRPSEPDDGPAIVALLQEAGLQPHTDPEHLHWKYWRSRPDWPGSRSFVLTDGRAILAHGAVVPGMCRWPGMRGRVLHMIDWAARRTEIGAGVALMKQVGQGADFLFGIGGSAQTLKLMPQIGYQQRGKVSGYVRSLSPRALLQRPARPAWKRLPRFARSALWFMTAPDPDVGEWRARRIATDEVGRLADVLPVERAGLGVFERSEALFRYLLECPIVPMELYLMERAGLVGGYFLLSYAPGQARLADCWMASDEAADWRALLHSAVRQTLHRAELAELVAWSSDPGLAQALMGCGFHRRLHLPIYLRGSRELPIPREPVRVQMLENDAAYLYFGAGELWA